MSIEMKSLTVEDVIIALPIFDKRLRQIAIRLRIYPIIMHVLLAWAFYVQRDIVVGPNAWIRDELAVSPHTASAVFAIVMLAWTIRFIRHPFWRRSTQDHLREIALYVLFCTPIMVYAFAATYFFIFEAINKPIVINSVYFAGVMVYLYEVYAYWLFLAEWQEAVKTTIDQRQFNHHE